MNTDLESLWRQYVLWPADRESVLDRAKAHVLKDPSGVRQRDRDSIFHRYENAEEKDHGKLLCLEALKALDKAPSRETAKAAYDQLSAVFLRPYFTSDKPLGSTALEKLKQDGVHPVRVSFLNYVALTAPDETAVLNALLFLEFYKAPPAPDVVLAFAEGGSWIFADRATGLIQKTELPPIEKLRAAYRIALAGGSLSERCFAGLLENAGEEVLNRSLPPVELREMRDFILKRLFVNFRPGVAHYVIDDYVDHIQNYLALGDILGALKTESPPDWLIAGALETFYELATGYDRGVIWREEDDDLMEKEALFVLIDHLKDRELDGEKMLHYMETKRLFEALSSDDRSKGDA